MLINSWNICIFAFVFSRTPSTVEGNQSFSVSVNFTIAGSAGRNYFIRAAFFHPDTPTSYFGYTKNHFDSWYNGTPSPVDFTQYKKITMNEFNSWAGMVEVKPDLESSAFKGAGVYNLKLRYYTESGSLSSETSNTVQLTIASTASPSPSPDPTPTLSPLPSPSLSPSPAPQVTPSPTPPPSSKPSPPSSSKPSSIAFSQPSPKPSLKPSPSSKEKAAVTQASDDTEKEMVLGVQSVAPPSPGQTPLESPEPSKKALFAGVTTEIALPAGLILLGVVFVGFSAFSFLKGKFSGKIDTQ